jgi:hypothetical protein
MHGRYDTSLYCLRKNRKAGINCFVYAYTSEADGLWCVKNKVHSTQGKNEINYKAQRSLSVCQFIDCDAVLLMGSDDYINASTLKRLKLLLKDHDYISFGSIVFEQGKTKMLWPGYPQTTARHGEPAGAGKLLRRDLLDALTWQVFTGSNNSAVDYNAHNNITARAQSPIQVRAEDGCILVDVKDADSMTPLNKFKYLNTWP